MLTSEHTFNNDIKTNLNKNTFHVEFNYHQQLNSDNDEDCSCNTCECSSCTDEDNYDENILTSKILPINDSHNYLNEYSRLSINSNRPSISSMKESNMKSISSETKDIINIPVESISMKQINEQIVEHQPSLAEQKLEHFPSIGNLETDKQKFSEIDFEFMYNLIDQSYTKIPIIYNSIKQTKLDTDFVLSVNNYLDRLKSNIYKDLIRRETLLRNGKNHTKNLISLIRCICKISYEQALEITNDSMTSKRAIVYTMAAIDYILQGNFPQKSICAINWERLQMLQNYRLTHFNQLMKPISINLEINKHFLLLFGKPLISTMKKSQLPITSLYSNRTDNEINNINEIQQIFKNSIAKILLEQSYSSKTNSIIEDDKLPSYQSHSQQIITPTIGITSSTSTKLINVDLNSKNKELSQSSSILNENRSMIEKYEQDQVKPALSMLDQQENPKLNSIPDTYTQFVEPILLPRHPSSTSSSTKPFLLSSLSDKFEQRQRFLSSESKLVSLAQQQLLTSIESTPKQNPSPTSISIHADQSFSPSNSSLSHSQPYTNTISNASTPVKPTEQINSSNESILTSKLINQISESLSNGSTSLMLIKSEHQNNAEQIRDVNDTSLTFSSPNKPFKNDHISSSVHQSFSNKSITMNSKAILDTEVNELINFLQEFACSSLSTQQENKTSPLLKLLESCLKQSTTDPKSIIEQVQNIHPQLSLSVKDPLFLAAFTRVLRKELRDAEILRKIDYKQLNEDSQNIDHLSFETSNILKLPNIDVFLKNKNTPAGDNIDQSRVFIEVTHDPSKCTTNTEFSDYQYYSCSQLSQQHQRCNDYSSPESMKPKSKNTILSSTESNNQQSLPSLESTCPLQRWYWMYSNKSSSCKDCIITPNSLYCERNSIDRSTYAITVEHNEEFL
ncbi:unnamed protein product [Rotaria sp. Silwood1]|nr:unnamed protein product [Rotaria sp. Silwood1]CAF0957052.1 unnamed protein product [Rotaria sp. Silwood1]CAF3421658.1 unnamed protein product [Rotaria sp. Silwood1]CAF4668567.1 unnamed protein product [Rotaria sp. Silwood1]